MIHNDNVELKNENITMLNCALEYGLQLEQYLREEKTKSQIAYLRRKYSYINPDIMRYVELFARLDVEFVNNSERLDYKQLNEMLYSNKLKPLYELINNTSWRGFWMNATGNDLERFITYIVLSLTEIDYDGNLVEIFKNQYPDYLRIPYSIVAAEEMRKKYFDI